MTRCLRAQVNPAVALTIDTTAFPPHGLLVRGRASVAVVDGVPPAYLAVSRTIISDGGFPVFAE